MASAPVIFSTTVMFAHQHIWPLHAWGVLTGDAAPRRFSELLQTLGGGGGAEEVVRLVEERQYALNSTAAAEYIRALLETKQLDKLAEGGAVQ